MSFCESILRCDAPALSPLPPPRACKNTGLPRLPASSTCGRSARCVDSSQSRLLCNTFVRRTTASVDPSEHFLRLLLLDILLQRRHCCHLLVILHVHPTALDHRRILRALHHRFEKQNVRAPPVHICFIWIWICDTVLSSRPACSPKVLSLSWNLDRNYLGTHMPVCWRPLAPMFKFDVPPQSPSFSSLAHALTGLGRGWFHTSDSRWKASLPWHTTSVRASHPKTRGVPQAQLQPFVIQKTSVHLFSCFRPTSVLVRFVCLLLTHSAVFTARSWRWDSSAPASCTDHIEIKRAKKDGMQSETFHKSSWSSFSSSSPPSFFSGFNVLIPSRGILGLLSIRVCPKIAAKTCS